MCGISGVYCGEKNKNIKDLEKAIESMNQSQFRRGPDDEGVFVDAKNGAVLGHRRLSILDLSRAGHQPMSYKRQMESDKGKDLVITFNGEIYNFLELKKELEKKNYKFKTKTDTEIILALYAEYGEKSFSMLRGMFAFGLWDAKNKKFFLAKDRYGIKPLYYYSDKEKLVFASTVKAVAESGLISVDKNPDAYIGFLLFGSVPLPATTYKNIFAVPAGHYLVREADNKQKLIKYYEPLDYFVKTKEFKNVKADEIVGDTKSFLNDAVESHLISDAPLGVFLSGGLDSSVIAALAAKNREKPITTLSVVFDEPEFSEQKYQRLAAQKIKSDHREIKITKQDFYDSFDDVFGAMDQPTIDGVNTFFIAKAAEEAGLKVVLSGLGADEIFLGYSHFKKAEMLRKIQGLPKPLKSALKLGTFFGDRYSKLGYFADNDVLSFYLGIRGLFSPQEAAKILNVNLSEVERFIEEFYSQSGYFLAAALASLHPVDLLAYLELKLYLQNQLLKDTDFMSMYHSIEVRVPFLDNPLVEYVSGLPPRLKLSTRSGSAFGGKSLRTEEFKNINKPLLVEATRDLLPQEIFTRPKMGFTFPFQKWLREADLKTYQFNNLKTNQHWSRFWAKIVLDKF